jgi:hypothetical protein
MHRFIKKFLAWDGLASGERGFIQAALMAAPYILNGLGGIFGNKKKYLDPEELRQKYGPQAIGRDTQAIANFILNSPYGQELMKQAATSGQELQTNLASNAASAGLSPDTGASSGASDFAAAAAPQAQAGLEGQTKAGIWQAALPVAANLNAGYAGLALANQNARNQEPSAFQKIAAAAGQLPSPGTPGAAVKKPGELEAILNRPTMRYV